MSICTRWITTIDDLRSLGPQYDAMVLATGAAGLFYQLGWLERVLPYYQARLGEDPAFLLAEQSGRLTALAPLGLRTRSWTHARQRVLSFIGGTGDELGNWLPGFLFAAHEPGGRAEVMSVFARAFVRERWDLIDLHFVKAAGSCRLALERELPGLRTTAERLATPRVCLPQGWQRYWETRSPRLLRVLERGEKRLRADGLGMKHQITAGVPAQRRGGVEAIHRARQERIRRAGRARNSPFDHPQSRAVFWSLVDWATAQGQLRAHWLWLGDQVAAYVIVLAHAGTSFAYFNAIDPAMERYHPGSLLLAALIEAEASGHGAQVVDLMLGANLTKSLFATEELAHVHLAAAHPLRRVALAKDTWIRWVRKRVLRR
jgi:hypothetical protein